MQKLKAKSPLSAGIIGAGPVGSLLSIFLAKAGIEGTLYERRGDLRKERVSAGRSINLALSTRGIHALEEAGVASKILAQAVPMYGRMIHLQTGEQAFQRYGVDDTQYPNSISRLELSRILMSEAESTGKVQIRFHERVSAVDFGKSTLRSIYESTSQELEHSHDLFFAADGSGSIVRQEFQKLPDFECTQIPAEYGYKELTIAADAAEAAQMKRNALHIWPRGKFMLIALPNFDGTFTCTLFLPYQGHPSFESLETTEKVLSFFQEFFPDTRTLFPDLAETFFHHPTGSMATVKCFPWNHRNTLLLGDAAHAILPFFGQGLNCGFEDCTVLNQLLASSSDFEAIFSEFSRVRKLNADKIAEMANENFIEMRDKVGDPQFLLRKAVETLLQKEFPNEFFSRYSLVTFSRIPYQAAAEIGIIGDEVISELCQGIQRPEEVNLAQAAKLIRSKLSPFFNERGQKYAFQHSR